MIGGVKPPVSRSRKTVSKIKPAASAKSRMKKVKPYLILAASVLAILAIYKVVVQPRLPDAAKNILPSV